MIRQGHVNVTTLGRNFYQARLNQSGMNSVPIVAGTYNSSEGQFRSVVSALIKAGDQQFERVKFHTPSDGAFSEEINRHTGHMRGAPHLTWSYASFLSAIREREQVYSMIRSH